jgi:hypothetical protein
MADVQHSLATYVSDMLALEEHVCIPFKTQRDDADFAKYPEAAVIVQRITTLSQTHIDTLASALQSLGGHEAHATKAMVTSIEGWFAGAIDKMRKTKVAKALRDDHTALSLCSAGYGMLMTTAGAFGNAQVEQLAQRHLHDYAQCIIEIADALPGVVVQDLRESGVPADAAVIGRCQTAIRSAWRATETPQVTTTTGTIESSPTIP